MAGAWKGLWLALQDKDERDAERERLKLSRDQFEQSMSFKREELELDRQKFMASLAERMRDSVEEVRKRREAEMAEVEAKAAKLRLAIKGFGLLEPVAVALERSGRLGNVIETLESRFKAGDLNPSAVKNINISVSQYLQDLTEEELANYTVQALLTPGDLTTPDGMNEALGTVFSYKESVLPAVEAARNQSTFDLSALSTRAMDESEYGRVMSDVVKTLAPVFGAPVIQSVGSDGQTTFSIDPDYQDSAGLNNLAMQVAKTVSDGVSNEGRPYSDVLTETFNEVAGLKNQGASLGELISRYGGVGPQPTAVETPEFLTPTAPRRGVDVGTPEEALDFLSGVANMGDSMANAQLSTEPPAIPTYDIFEELRTEGYR